MLPFVRRTIKRQLKQVGLDNHFSCRIDFMQAYIRKLEDEKHFVLSVKEMTRTSAENYLPEVFAHTMLDLKKEDYAEMLSGAKKIVVCEVSPEGSAYEVYKRMKYVIEAGDMMKAGLFDPDVSVLMNHMDSRYHVIQCIWGANMEEAKRYTKAVAVQVVR